MTFLNYLKYFFFWVGYFLVARLIFVCYHFNSAQSVGFQNIIGSFTHGIRLDLSAAGYFSVLPFAFFTFSFLFTKKDFFGGVIKIYTILFILISSWLIASDLELFKNWGYRLDDTFLKYLLSPTEAAASISSYPILLLFIIFLVFSSLSIYIFNKIILKKRVYTEGGLIDGVTQSHPVNGSIGKRIFSFLLGALITVALILPIRGGWQLAPVNQSAVYFSDKPFANYAAVNAMWNFFVSTYEKTSEETNPYTYFPENEAITTLKNLFSDTAKTQKLIRSDITQPNILIITYESLTAKVIEKLGGERGITPNFDSLTHDGILFTNMYASGDRTDRGLVAVLSGYPAIPRANIMEVPRKSSQLPILSQIFVSDSNKIGWKQKYETGFYYGGEVEFANMKSYLLTGQFSKLITKSDFKKEDLSSKWGAFDHVVFEKLLTDLKTVQQPFFINLLTQSSHEPFEIPHGWGKPNLPATDDLDEKFRRVHFYSDQALGAFIRAAKKENWWQNTLIIVIADHSSHHIEPHEDYFAKFHIPMLWLGGALSVRDTLIPQVCSQVDLAATVLSQLDVPHTQFKWSKNILSTNYQPFAYFAFQNGFGFVQNNKRYVFDSEGAFLIQKDGAIDSLDVQKGKAFLQMSYQDYLKK
jgi:phosphoglycerol transferase MdoB-like AlkP superfamily enzyme